MTKHIYTALIILVTITFYSCEDFGVEPNEGNLTYKIIGNSPASNERGLFISKLNDNYILGGITNVATNQDYMLAKADKNGEVTLNFNAGLSLTDDDLTQVIITDEANKELFVLLNQESPQTFKVTPALAKITYAIPDTSTTIDNSNFIERDNFPNENDIVREIAVKGLHLANSSQFLILSNIIEKDKQKIRVTLVDQFSGSQVWSRVYSFDNGSTTPPNLDGIGISQKSTGNFTVMGNMTTENPNTGEDDVKIFVLEIDDLGNEVNVKFPIQGELLLDFTNISGDEYALMTTKIESLDIVFQDLKTYKYNATSFALTPTNTFKSDETDADIIGKSIQRIGQNIIITSIEEGSLNKAVIYKLDLDLQEKWKKDYYYTETVINRLDIGNAIERIGGGYAVIGTHDLKSSTKMVLLLLDENGNYIDN